jgi:hypothetical protein
VHTYEVPVWRFVRDAPTSGDDPSQVRWPDPTLAAGEREGPRTESYLARFGRPNPPGLDGVLLAREHCDAGLRAAAQRHGNRLPADYGSPIGPISAWPARTSVDDRGRRPIGSARSSGSLDFGIGKSKSHIERTVPTFYPPA